MLGRFCVDFKETLMEALAFKFRDLVKILLCEFHSQHNLLKPVFLKQNQETGGLGVNLEDIANEINDWHNQVRVFRF